VQVRILREMTAKGEVPLRLGVTQLLDDALAEGARVAVVAATASVPEDGLVSSAMFNLGPNRQDTRGLGAGGVARLSIMGSQIYCSPYFIACMREFVTGLVDQSPEQSPDGDSIS
jgi:hypothetical protein